MHYGNEMFLLPEMHEKKQVERENSIENSAEACAPMYLRSAITK